MSEREREREREREKDREWAQFTIKVGVLDAGNVGW